MNQFLLGLLAGVAVGLSLEWIVDWSGLTTPGRRPVRRNSREADAQVAHETPAAGGATARPDSASRPQNRSEA